MKNTKTNNNKNSNKLTGLILAAAVSSLIVTGCSSTSSGSFSAAEVSPATIMASPVKHTQFGARPDTHPELRSGLWQTTSREQVRVVETPALENQNPEAADSTQLIAFNPAVINAATELASGAVITEAAGAQNDLKNYQLSLEERVRAENANK